MKKFFTLFAFLFFINSAFAQTIIPSSSSVIIPGTSVIVGGTSGKMLYDNAGVIGEANVYAATNSIELRNSTNAQSILVNRTYTSATSYERLFVGADHTGTGITGFAVFAESGSGGGSARALYLGTTGNAVMAFVTNNSTKWTIGATGHITANTDNAYDIGASGATRPRAIYVGSTITAGTTIQSTGGNVTGNGFVINRGGTNYASILDDGDGNIRLYNGAANNFNLLKFGGTTSSFPALKRSTVGIQVRLADDSAFTSIQGKLATDTNYAAGAPAATGYLTIYDATGTAYRVLAAL